MHRQKKSDIYMYRMNKKIIICIHIIQTKNQIFKKYIFNKQKNPQTGIVLYYHFLFIAASTNPVNIGCGLNGREINSG